MLVGYARVSTEDQSLDLQLDELKVCGCERIYSEQISGVKENRPELEQALQFVRSGDTLVVWRLDRLGRSLKHVIEIINRLALEGINFVSLKEGFDTTSAAGQFFFHVVASFAQYERALLQERTMAGLAAARARGRKGGRPRKLSEVQVAQAKALAADPKISIDSICETYGISLRTYYRHIAPAQGYGGRGEEQHGGCGQVV
ncbi:MAG: recombinase family protein [Oscillatoria sp. SIO1A7]|nr:recombinase family protein [Oscillatoria sp. SIO1A7]